ncbi:MAG: isochorismatase family cysteine hydrolase [Chloroflexota bacterium]
MKQRGGYLPASIERTGRLAVLVVDMLNDFAHPDGAYARHGAVCESFPAIVPNVRRLMLAAEGAGVPTVSAHQVVYADRSGRAVTGGGMEVTRPWLEEEGFRPGTWGSEMIEELPAASFRVDKPRASAFLYTPLDVILKGLGTDTVVIAGCYTNQCVVSTARDAWARDLQVLIVVDGVAAFDRRLHEATLESLRPLTVQVTTEEACRLLSAE